MLDSSLVHHYPSSRRKRVFILPIHFRCRRDQVDCSECDGCRLLRQFYRKQYVERFHFDHIADPQLQALMVDWAVTSSGVRPVKALQRALGFTADASDGVFGPGTQRALERVGNAREL